MTWFFVALLTPILFAAVVHLDKYLIARFKNEGKEKSVGSLILYSSLFGLVISAFILPIFGSKLFLIPLVDIGILFLTGFSGIIAVILYLYAMEKDEASIVAPLFQIVPIFGLIFEYLILGIVPSILQIIGSLVIVLAGVILASELEEFRIKKIKAGLLLLMIGSSMLFSLTAILFKFVTTETGGNFWISSFWEYLSWGIVGIILFIFIKTYREDFLLSLKKDGKILFSMNIGGELLNTIANSAKNFAALSVPVVLVYSIEALQPVFIFLFGILITIFLPKISTENISKRALVQKGLPILFMILGTILILN